MLFQACLDPCSQYTLNGLTLMPFDQILFYCYAIILAFSNIYLYRFLQKQSQNNKAKKENDLIRDRKRNFVTARTGMFAVFVMVLSTFVFHVVYNFEYWTGILGLEYTLDSSTKALIISVYGLTFDCIINPLVLLSNAPTVQKAVHKWKIKENMKSFLGSQSSHHDNV